MGVILYIGFSRLILKIQGEGWVAKILLWENKIARRPSE
jgi:hypothetical protein